MSKSIRFRHPYDHIDPGTGIWVNKRSYGVALRLFPANIESMPAEKLNFVWEQALGVLDRVPEDTYVQIHLDIRKNTKETFEIYQAQKSKPQSEQLANLLDRMKINQSNYYQKAGTQGFFHEKSMTPPPLLHQVWMTVYRTFDPSELEAHLLKHTLSKTVQWLLMIPGVNRLKDKLHKLPQSAVSNFLRLQDATTMKESIEQHYQAWLHQKFQDIVEIRQNFTSALLECGVAVEEVRSEDLLFYIRNRLNLNPETPLFSHHSVGEQVSEDDGQYDGIGFTLNGDTEKYTACGLMSNLPERAKFNLLEALGTLHAEFGVTINLYRVVTVDIEDDLKQGAVQEFFLGFSERTRLQMEQLDNFVKELQQGRSGFRGNIIIHTQQDSQEEAIGVIQRVQQRLRGVRLQFKLDRYNGADLYRQALPYGYSKEVLQTLDRDLLCNSLHLRPFLPFFGGVQSHPIPDLLFLTRNGQPVFKSLRFSEDTHHGYVIADSRSGKTFLCMYLLKSVLAYGGIGIWVDIRNSLEKFTEVMGGEYVKIQSDAPLPINVFEGELTNDKQAFLTLWLRCMCEGRNPEDRLIMLDIETLQEGIKEAYREVDAIANKGGFSRESGLVETVGRSVEVTMTDIISALGKLGSRGIDLARRLGMYAEGGMHGKVFDVQQKTKKSLMHSPLVVFDLGAIKDYPELKDPIFLAISAWTQMRVGKRLDRLGMFGFDECWDVLRSEIGANWVETAGRAMAAYNIAVWVIVQGIDTLLDTPAGKAFADNAHFHLFLKQNENFGTDATKHGFDPAIIRRIQKIHTRRGDYSEIFWREKGEPEYTGTLRFIADPWMYAVFSSDASDNVEQEMILQKIRTQYPHRSLQEQLLLMLEQFTQRYPFGVPKQV